LYLQMNLDPRFVRASLPCRALYVHLLFDLDDDGCYQPDRCLPVEETLSTLLPLWTVGQVAGALEEAVRRGMVERLEDGGLRVRRFTAWQTLSPPEVEAEQARLLSRMARRVGRRQIWKLLERDWITDPRLQRSTAELQALFFQAFVEADGDGRLPSSGNLLEDVRATFFFEAEAAVQALVEGVRRGLLRVAGERLSISREICCPLPGDADPDPVDLQCLPAYLREAHARLERGEVLRMPLVPARQAPSQGAFAFLGSTGSAPPPPPLPGHPTTLPPPAVPVAQEGIPASLPPPAAPPLAPAPDLGQNGNPVPARRGRHPTVADPRLAGLVGDARHNRLKQIRRDDRRQDDHHVAHRITTEPTDDTSAHGGMARIQDRRPEIGGELGPWPEINSGHSGHSGHAVPDPSRSDDVSSSPECVRDNPPDSHTQSGSGSSPDGSSTGMARIADGPNSPPDLPPMARIPPAGISGHAADEGGVGAGAEGGGDVGAGGRASAAGRPGPVRPKPKSRRSKSLPEEQDEDRLFDVEEMLVKLANGIDGERRKRFRFTAWSSVGLLLPVREQCRMCVREGFTLADVDVLLDYIRAGGWDWREIRIGNQHLLKNGWLVLALDEARAWREDGGGPVVDGLQSLRYSARRRQAGAGAAGRREDAPSPGEAQQAVEDLLVAGKAHPIANGTAAEIEPEEFYQSVSAEIAARRRDEVHGGG
jgi:hypothetical protein